MYASSSSLHRYVLKSPSSSFLTGMPTSFRSPHHLLRQSRLFLRPKSSTPLRKLITNQTHVSTTLATHLLSHKSPQTNVVFSPLSMHVVLSLIATGAKGRTLDQLLGFLKAKTTDDLNSLSSHLASVILADGSQRGGPRLMCANGLWVEKTLSLKPSFKHVVDTVYKATCEQVDFQHEAIEVVNQVNAWAKKHTNGLITEVLSANAVNNLTWLIFANAIYFKGQWQEKFDHSMTQKSDFYLLNGSKVQVPFMRSNKKQCVCEYDGFKVLRLPYFKGQDTRKFSMYFYLPDDKKGLQSLMDKISSTPDFFDTHIPNKIEEVGKFLLPKFKISFGFEFSEMLKELGLVLPFSDKDGLSEMVDSPTGEIVYVWGIHQRSIVEVDEQGTEAAAVTASVMLGTCALMKKREMDFVADHPFLFVIREDVSGAILFMGKVIDPTLG